MYLRSMVCCNNNAPKEESYHNPLQPAPVIRKGGWGKAELNDSVCSVIKACEAGYNCPKNSNPLPKARIHCYSKGAR